jgi:hypothetical protein
MSNISIKTLENYIRINESSLRYIRIGVSYNTYIIQNNNDFDRRSIKDTILLHELINLCQTESILYAQIFLNEDYSLMDKVKKDLNMFDGIEYVKDETDN